MLWQISVNQRTKAIHNQSSSLSKKAHVVANISKSKNKSNSQLITKYYYIGTVVANISKSKNKSNSQLTYTSIRQRPSCGKYQ